MQVVPAGFSRPTGAQLSLSVLVVVSLGKDTEERGKKATQAEE